MRHEFENKFINLEFFNTKILSQHLWFSDSIAALKKTERWLKDVGLNFPLIVETNILDEHKRVAKNQVLKQITKKARDKRKLVLFASLYCYQNNNYIIANDSRRGRRWILLKDGINPKTIEKGFEILVKKEGKDTLIIPSGKLVKTCRKITRKWKSNTSKLGNGNELRLCLEIFTHSQDDIHVFFDKTRIVEPSNRITHLDFLEAEAIYIMREVVAQAKNPVMLYSVGKDSSVMLHLALKAFYPGLPPFPLLHVDTCWKFQAMYDFRDYIVKRSGMELIIHVNQEGLDKNINPFDHGSSVHTNIMKTMALKQALNKFKFDFAFGGARRDEEKSRAKERIFSFRDSEHRWDAKNQRPELWDYYNGLIAPGEGVRVFPLSNWTELDVWHYIYREKIPIVPLYFAEERAVVERNGELLMIDDDRFNLHHKEKIQIKKVRFRSLGCYPLTSAIESEANDLASIILELMVTKTSERMGRTIDLDTSSSMEKKKEEGYF